MEENWDLSTIVIGTYVFTEAFLRKVIDPSTLGVLSNVRRRGEWVLDGEWKKATKPNTHTTRMMASRTGLVIRNGPLMYCGEKGTDGYVHTTDDRMKVIYQDGGYEVVVQQTDRFRHGEYLKLVMAGTCLVGELNNIGPSTLTYRDGTVTPTYHHYGREIPHGEILDLYGYLPVEMTDEEKMLWALKYPQ